MLRALLLIPAFKARTLTPFYIELSISGIRIIKRLKTGKKFP